MNEGLQVLQKFWDGQSVFFKGDHFKINGGSMNRTDIRIPITVAAKGEKTMTIAAKYANVWEASYISPDKFQSLEARFKEIFNRENRISNDKIIRSIELDVIIAKSESELEYKKKLFMMDRGPGVFNQIMRNGLVGTPERIREKIKDYVNAGVEQFFLAFHDPFNHDDLELIL